MPKPSAAAFSPESIWNLLCEVQDPEIPVLSVVDLGIVRSVELEDKKVIVSITTTYSGCPAMKVIEQEIIDKLSQSGVEQVEVRIVHYPVWTTDWLSDDAKEKLREYGISPPEKTDPQQLFHSNRLKIVACPRCRSVHTTLVSQFGSTPCKALYTCNDCKEPFDYFKCH